MQGGEGRGRERKRESDLRIARDILIKILTAQGTDKERETEKKGERGER